MIVSFRHKGLKLFYEEESVRGIQPAHSKRLKRLLTVLDQSQGPEDLTDPSLRAHQLKGVRERFWSVWVNGSWRLTFRFLGKDVELLNYEDYH